MLEIDRVNNLITINKRYGQYKARAKRNNLDFAISRELFTLFVTSKCYICALNGEYNKLGLDRLNNEKGYIKGNIAPCCWNCNRSKSKMTTQQFHTWLNRIQPKHPLLRGHVQIHVSDTMRIDIYSKVFIGK